MFDQYLTGFREDLERERMTDTFATYAPADKTKGTDGDGFEVDVWPSRGEVLGYVQSVSRGGGDTQTEYAEIGGVDRPVMHGGLRIPITAPVPVAGQRGRGWEYVCTAVGPSSDPALLGRRWLVWEVPAKSAATARRLTVVEVSDGRSHDDDAG